MPNVSLPALSVFSWAGAQLDALADGADGLVEVELSFCGAHAAVAEASTTVSPLVRIRRGVRMPETIVGAYDNSSTNSGGPACFGCAPPGVVKAGGPLHLTVAEGDGEGWQSDLYGGKPRWFAHHRRDSLMGMLADAGFTRGSVRHRLIHRHWLAIAARRD